MRVLKKALIPILVVSILSNFGCATLKEQYEVKSHEVVEYCEATIKDAGYLKNSKAKKYLMAKCISRTQDRVHISNDLFGIVIGIISVQLAISSLRF